MNKFYLTFITSKFEQKFQAERFEIEKYLLEKMRVICTICVIFVAINNYLTGNYIYATMVLIALALGLILFKFAMQNYLYVDVLILAIQLILRSIYPFLIYFQIKFGTETDVDISRQYMRASIVNMLSYSLMIGSKYYLLSAVFVYETFIQLLLYFLEKPIFYYQIPTIQIMACIALLIHIYTKELAIRRQFIAKEQSIIFNQNILSTFQQAWFQCYNENGLIFLYNQNEFCKQNYGLLDHRSFIQFLKTVKTKDKNKPNLFAYCSSILESNSSKSADIIKVCCFYMGKSLLINISRILNETKIMLLITINNRIDETLERTLRQQVGELKVILHRTQYFIKYYLERPQEHQLKLYSQQRLSLQFHTLVSKYLKLEKIESIDLSSEIEDIIQSNFQLIRNREIKVYVKLGEQVSKLQNMKYHLYLLLQNLVIAAIEKCNERTFLLINFSQSSDYVRPRYSFSQESQIIQLTIRYQGEQLESQLFKDIDPLVRRVCTCRKITKKLSYPFIEYVILFSHL